MGFRDVGLAVTRGSQSEGALRLQRKCTACEEDDRVNLRRKELSNSAPKRVGHSFSRLAVFEGDTAPADVAGNEAPPIVHEVLSSSGEPMESESRRVMESGFETLGAQHEFQAVRLHTDSKAAESAAEVNALAYTVGNHIVFGKSQYDPTSTAGRRLLAHELAHTLQQSASNPVLNRQDAGTTAGCPESTRSDFCQPFASRAEARACRDQMVRAFIPLDQEIFGPEVAGLWRMYLSRKNGDSLTRQVFSDTSHRIVRGFVQSQTTAERQTQIVDRIKAELPTHCPTLPAHLATRVPLNRILAPADLNFPINFNRPFEIPGHIAGNVGSSDAGPDTRQVSGDVILTRHTDEQGRTTGIYLITDFQFRVLDALDFCPGDPGTGQEQAITIPLSRLEATGLFLRDEAFAYDIPIDVRYTGPELRMDLDMATVRSCFPDAVGPDAGPTQPTPPPPPSPPSETRPEER